MNPIYKTLFDTYGDHILREAETYDEDEINARLSELSLDEAALVQIDNLFSTITTAGQSTHFHWASTWGCP